MAARATREQMLSSAKFQFVAAASGSTNQALPSHRLPVLSHIARHMGSRLTPFYSQMCDSQVVARVTKLVNKSVLQPNISSPPGRENLMTSSTRLRAAPNRI